MQPVLTNFSLAILACCTTLACSDSDDKNALNGNDSGMEPDATVAVEPTANCGASQLAAGEHSLTMMHDGVEREYLLRVPERTDTALMSPLLVNAHGYTSNMTQQAGYAGVGAAGAAGYFVVFPGGLDDSWNGGACCGLSSEQDRDDVGFLVALVDELAEQLCVDRRRVYATGMSNGGFMSHRLACEAADVFAAIAPVAGVLGIAPEACKPSRPIPVMHFHGQADSLVAYDGGGAAGFISAPESFAAWAQINGCKDTPTVTFSGSATTCETYSDCEADVEVTLCSSQEAGHCWPGIDLCGFGSPATDISANDEMFKFFERFSLP